MAGVYLVLITQACWLVKLNKLQSHALLCGNRCVTVTGWGMCLATVQGRLYKNYVFELCTVKPLYKDTPEIRTPL